MARVKYTYLASSFADEEDVRRFNECKDAGGTDHECFEVGDNGIGQFGSVTAQSHTPMVALHADDMVARWGSVEAAAHRRVRIERGGLHCFAGVEDRCGRRGRIDLNPACLLALKMKAPCLEPVEWSWVDGDGSQEKR